MLIYLDFETRWKPGKAVKPGLNDFGVARCASHHSAGINAAAIAYDDAPVTVVPFQYDRHAWKDPRFPHPLRDFYYAAINPANKVVVHNAGFELMVLKYLLDMDIPPSQFICTMAKAGYYGYPRSLDGLAKALNLDLLKDIQGSSAMLQLIDPAITPADRPDLFETLYRYCGIDVEVMRKANKVLPDLPPDICERWLVDMEINCFGMPVDVQALENAVNLRAQCQLINDARMVELTNGYITTVGQGERIQEFAKANGVEMIDCTADTVTKTLQQALPENVRAVLELRQEGNLTSLAKYQKMLDYQLDGRLYQMADWYGAHTGRPTGRGPQVLNMTRSEDPVGWAEVVSKAPGLIMMCERPAERLKDCTRGMICAPKGKVFLGTDLAQIEARATGWVAGEEKFLNLFRTSDPYCTYGATIFGRTITKKDNPIERTASKASMLSLGFAGGIGAYQRVASNYQIDFEMVAQIILPTATPSEWAEAERCYKYYMKSKPLKPLSHRHAIACDIVKQRYRRDFENIKQFWFILEDAFKNGGQAGPILIEKRDRLRILVLPSGRPLYYHGFKETSRMVRDPDDDSEKEQRGYGYEGRHGFKFLWRGTIMENVAQAINADISDWYKVRAHREIAPVMHHCYDEFTLELNESELDRVQLQLKELLATQPDWSQGLPLGFDSWVDYRYGK